MAVDIRLCITEQYQDHSTFIVSDVSSWLSVSPDRRDDAARFLVAAKMDESQVLSFLATLNDDPYNALSWSIESAGIGAYRFFYFSFADYDSETPYVGEILVDGVRAYYGHIVEHNGILYKAIANSEGIEPGIDEAWEEFWTIYDSSFLKDEVENPYLTIHIHDDIITSEYEECILDYLDEVADKELCGGCCDTDAFLKLMKMQFMLDAAESANWQQKTPRAEVILKEASKKFCC